jgi:DNA repair exonuclease SbcCD nuclease subunit
MAKPIAVCISDLHFTVQTLELATKALTAAISRALELNVPLVIAGDTLDSKAIIRGECANRLLEIFTGGLPEIYILVGNHDLLSEKGDDNSLNFLDSACVEVVSRPTFVPHLNTTLVPYMNYPDKMQKFLNEFRHEPSSRIICHQGVQSAHMGHYVQDKTSLPKEAFKDFRTISGHYHRAQDIECGPPRKGAVGLFSYIGNPYTLSFGEANDGPKGYQILMDDGILELMPLNLRKHVIIEASSYELQMNVKAVKGGCKWVGARKEDLVWFRVSGTRLELDMLNKREIGEVLLGHSNFKLDKIYTDAPILEVNTGKLTDSEMLDAIIDNENENKDEKLYLKQLWREILK